MSSHKEARVPEPGFRAQVPGGHEARTRLCSARSPGRWGPACLLHCPSALPLAPPAFRSLLPARSLCLSPCPPILLFINPSASLLPPGTSRADTRAIGAQECQRNSQPWQAGLFYRTHLLCGASLISDRWLLTAAHCHKR